MATWLSDPVNLLLLDPAFIMGYIIIIIIFIMWFDLRRD